MGFDFQFPLVDMAARSFPSLLQRCTPLLLIDKLFDLTCPVPEGAVTESNDGQEGIFAGGMVPNPVFAHIQSLCDIIHRQNGILLKLCIQE